MKIEVDANELATLLDGLGALPLARGYNLFNRVMQQGLQEGLIKQQPAPSAAPEGQVVGEATEVKAPMQ